MSSTGAPGSNDSAIPVSPAALAALERLREGNRRFAGGVRSIDPLLAHLKMAELAVNGQKPFAVVLACSDSRVPAEMIFDQGLGDLFVIRVAGNVIAPSLLASIEFALLNFGSSAVVVLGHTQCGAIHATVEHVRNPLEPLPSANLEELISRVRPAVERALCTHQIDEKDFDRAAMVENVLRSHRLITEQSLIARDLAEAGKIAIAGAVLDISTGLVEFL